jgi:hypothetical protein
MPLVDFHQCVQSTVPGTCHSRLPYVITEPWRLSGEQFSECRSELCEEDLGNQVEPVSLISPQKVGKKIVKTISAHAKSTGVKTLRASKIIFISWHYPYSAPMCTVPDDGVFWGWSGGLWGEEPVLVELLPVPEHHTVLVLSPRHRRRADQFTANHLQTKTFLCDNVAILFLGHLFNALIGLKKRVADPDPN